MEKSSSGYNAGMYSPDIHELYRDLELGYTATVNKVQGLSIDNVFFYIDKNYPHLNRNLIYSGITRAKKSIQLIVKPVLLRAVLNKKI
ncbi:ATP-binding domain-containing protein [Weissella oryzae]|nr:ATP-binding domain-containing protein [Weissella oryzae]